MYDYTGPGASLTRNGYVFTLTFNEKPTQFTRFYLEIRSYVNTAYLGSNSPGQDIYDFTPVGNSGRVWTFTLPSYIADYPDIYGSGQTYSLGVRETTDIDGNIGDYRELLLNY